MPSADVVIPPFVAAGLGAGEAFINHTDSQAGRYGCWMKERVNWYRGAEALAGVGLSFTTVPPRYTYTLAICGFAGIGARLGAGLARGSTFKAGSGCGASGGQAAQALTPSFPLEPPGRIPVGPSSSIPVPIGMGGLVEIHPHVEVHPKAEPVKVPIPVPQFPGRSRRR